MSINDSLCPVTKNQFESMLGEKITEMHWAEIQNDIVGRMDNFLNELLETIAQDVQAELDEQAELDKQAELDEIEAQEEEY